MTTEINIHWEHQHAGWGGRGVQIPACDFGVAERDGVRFTFDIQHFRCRFDGIHARLRAMRKTGEGDAAVFEAVMDVKVNGRPKAANARAKQLAEEFMAGDPVGAFGVDCEDFDAVLPQTEDGERVDVK